jgi:hypothetical protein
LIAARTILNFKLERFEFCPAHESFKAQVQSVRVYANEFANAHTDFEDVAASKAARFRANRVEHRIGDSHFVHGSSSADSRQLAAGEQIDDSRSSQTRSHRDHRRMGVRNRSDDPRVMPEQMALHHFEHSFSRRGRDHR